MKEIKKHKLHFIGITYWFLLLYIISALVWWFISLEKQNKQMYLYRYEQLKKDDIQFGAKLEALNDAKYRKSLQYVGEGLTFFVLIMVGAAYVYRTIRRQIKTSDQQQNFMMAITHELKTPIAIIRLNLETMQKRKLLPEQQQKLLASTLVESERLNNLTSNILITAELEGGRYKLHKTSLNLSELTSSCVQVYITRHPNRNIKAQVEPGIWVNGEHLLLQMLINNLLDNAVKYSPIDSPVILEVEKKGKLVEISIKDSGSGIADADKKLVFSKFYRVGSESVRTAKGTGLGLYLCRKIVKDHNGTLIIRDNQPKGSIFTITLAQIKS